MLREINKILSSRPFSIGKKISESTVIKNLPQWDSLKHLMFLIELEKKFTLEITPDQIQSIKNIKQLVKLIRQKNDNKRIKK